MSTNAPYSEKRIAGRPKWIVLCTDDDGRDWLWRTTDDAIVTVADTRIVQRRSLPADEPPEALLARIGHDIGIADQHYHGTLAAALADAIEVDQ